MGYHETRGYSGTKHAGTVKSILRVFGLYAQGMGMNEKVVSSQICFLPKVAVKQDALVPGRLETFGGMVTVVMTVTVVVATRM